MSLERTSSFFCSSPWTLVSPARPTLGAREGLPGAEKRGRGEHAQVDEAGLADVGGDELGGELDGGEEEGEVAGGDSAEAELLAQDMAGGSRAISVRAGRVCGGAGETHRVRVMRSVLTCSSPDIAWTAGGGCGYDEGGGGTGIG